MTRIWISVGLVALLATSGCKKSDPSASGPTDPKKQAATDSKHTTPHNDESTKLAEEATAAAVDPDLPTYTDEQRAAARQLASDLGVVIKEDKDGNVTSIDTAVGRSWADDYQMQEILVFPTLTSLTVEGPSISDALATDVTDGVIDILSQLKKLKQLTITETGIGEEGVRKLKAALPDCTIRS